MSFNIGGKKIYYSGADQQREEAEAAALAEKAPLAGKWDLSTEELLNKLSQPEAPMSQDPMMSAPPPTIDPNKLEASGNKGLMMSGTGPDMDYTKIEDPGARQEILKRALGVKSPDDGFAAAMDRADEARSNKEFLATVGMGMNQINQGLSGAQPQNDLYKNTLSGAGDKAKTLRDYMMKKHEIGVREKEADRANKILGETLRHNKATEDLSAAELGLKAKTEANKIPEPVKVAAEETSKSIANRVTISQSLESYTDTMNAAIKAGDRDKALQMGRQMIKTLNSDQGKDAVGAEESKRLASKLTYAFGNFTNDNPTQWGRDLEGFISDAKSTANVLRDSATKSKETYKSMTGKDHPIVVPPKIMTDEEKSIERGRKIDELLKKAGG